MQNKIYLLVDCNNFYVSCERVFNPRLEKKPVVVLSNNDGCIISRSNEAKVLNIPMGSPFFKCKKMIKKHNISVFSSNYSLYGDMSNRVMQVLSSFVPNIEIYSIDEAFLLLRDFKTADLTAFAKYIRHKVKKYTGIPVSIGIGRTKTLAKVANKLAKQNKEYDGVYSLFGKSDSVLDSVLVKDIWGVGRKYSQFLNSRGINTALQFINLPETFVKNNMTVIGLKTQLELKGISCNEFDADTPKKNITRSRSFGKPLNKFNDIQGALVEFTSRAGEKLRDYNLCASNIHVFIETNFLKKNDKQYSNISMKTFLTPTSNSSDLITYAIRALKIIFKNGYDYKKAGVMLTGLVAKENVQLELFKNDSMKKRNVKLMETIDKINFLYGKNTLRYACGIVGESWQMNQNRLSNRFTTHWNQLPLVKAV